MVKRSYIALLLPILAACAQIMPETEKPSYTYQDFEQRVPASMNPPVTEAIDELHLKTQADYHFTMAEAYSLEGQTDKAIESYKLVLVYDQTAVHVRVKLATEYLKKGYISEAIKEADQAIKERPNLVSARFLLAGIYTTLKMYGKAREQYEMIHSLEPTNEEALLYIGAIYVEEKKFDQAIETFRMASKLKDAKGAYLAHFYIGKVQLLKNKRSDAEKAFEKALAINPKFVDAVLSLGSLYEEKSREMTKKLYKSFIDKFGEDDKIAESLAHLYIEDEQYDLAIKYLTMIDDSNYSLGASVKIAMIYIEQKKYDQAIDKLKAILREVPDSDKIKFYLAAVYEEVGESDNAVELYKQIPLASSYYVDAVLHGVYLLKTASRYDEAIEWNRQALKRRADVIQFYTMYASLLDDKKEYKTALTFLKGSEKQFPEDEQIQYFLGSFFDKLGDKREAIKRMEKVLQMNAQHSPAMNFIAYTYAELGENLEDAERMALRANELKPKDPYYLDTLGWVYLKKGDAKKAIQYLEAAYKLAPKESIIAHHLGDAYYQYQLLMKAKLLYKKAFETERDRDEKQKIRQKLAATEKALSNAAAKQVAAPATASDETRAPASQD